MEISKTIFVLFTFIEPVYTDSSSRTITDHDHLHITEVPYTIVIENTNTEPILKLTNTSRGVMVPPTVLLEKDHSKTYTDNGNDTTDNSTTKSTIPKCETSEGLCDSLSHDAHVNEPKIKTTYVPDNSRSVTPNKIQLTTPECEFSKEKDCELLRHVINNAKTNAVPVLTKSTLRNVVVSAIMTTQQTKVTETTLVNKPTKLPMKRTTMDFEKLLVDVINKSNLSVPQSTQSEIERIEVSRNCKLNIMSVLIIQQYLCHQQPLSYHFFLLMSKTASMPKLLCLCLSRNISRSVFLRRIFIGPFYFFEKSCLINLTMTTTSNLNQIFFLI